MNKEDFLLQLQETLQRDEPLSMGTPFAEVSEWDSLAAMSAHALAARSFGKTLKLKEITAAASPGDLYALFTG